MKLLLTLTTLFVLTGCAGIYESKFESPANSTCSLNMNIGVEGFNFNYMGRSGVSTGHAYNWSNGQSATATFVHSSLQTSDDINGYVRRVMENLGVNTRNKNPEIILVGDVGNGSLDLSNVVGDSLINIGLLTTTALSRRKNWCTIRVYSPSGEFIKQYSAKGSHCYTTVGIPFHFYGALNKHC